MADQKPKGNPLSKRHALLKGLTRLIETSAGGDRLPSYTVMCRRFGVCQSTINDVLKDLEQSGLVERRPWKGIFVSEGAKKRRIGIVFDRDVFMPGFSPVYSQFMNEAHRRAAEGREEIRFYIDAPLSARLPGHSDLVSDLENGLLQGVVLIFGRSEEEIQFFSSLPIPIAVFQPNWEMPNDVRINYAAVISEGVRRLAALNCRTVGFINHLEHKLHLGKSDIDYSEIFRQAAQEAGLQPLEEWMINVEGITPTDPSEPFPSHEELGYRAFHKRVSTRPASKGKPRFPDGFVSTDDMHTRGVLLALERDFRLHVGSDIQIATHSNKGSSALFGYEENLELLEIDPARIVDALFQIIETQINEGRRRGKTTLIEPSPPARPLVAMPG